MASRENTKASNRASSVGSKAWKKKTHSRISRRRAKAELVAVAVDTSMSISKKELRKFVAETARLARRGGEVREFDADTRIRPGWGS